LGGDAAVFELVNHEIHHHLVCRRCNSVLQLDDDTLLPLRDAIGRSQGFQVSSTPLTLFGVCAACAHALANAPK
jgi:Fur family ferric uptake transcriptional regulator